LCLGDVMLDRYVRGSVSRISPEAPVPVLNMSECVAMPGGAANVARNVCALGGRAHLVSAAGRDADCDELRALLSGPSGPSVTLIEVPGRRTTVKTRLVGNHQQIARLDVEDADDIGSEIEDQVCAAYEAAVAACDAVLLSDYRKGLLTDRVVRRAIAAAVANGRPAVVDPKGRDFGRYRGATCLTPNLAELAAVLGFTPLTQQQIAEGALALVRDFDLKAMLVTLSERGMVLIQADGCVSSVPALARDVSDVSGAGDTVVATLALSLASGLPLETGMALANAAAAVVVGKAGTAVCTIAELETQMLAGDAGGSGKVVGRRLDLNSRVAQWRRDGLTVGLTNGCFDIIHAGHVKLLREAREHCDRLVVAVNSDDSVRRLKGPQRPINTSADRCTVLEALSCVDAVTTFDEDTPLDLIRFVQPDVLIKGGDYTIETVVGADLVEAAGGRVVLVDLLPGTSTTGIWHRFRPRLAVAE